MKTFAVTAEYNPFHNGHAYQIRKARELSGADFCTVIMSPDFVQRGEPAFVDKYTRTKMALSGGADLVLELPVRYALSSAQNFARGSIGIMHALGCIDLVSFGCEAGRIGDLSAAARILADEPDAYRRTLADHLKCGMSYPSAREKALCDYLCADHSVPADERFAAYWESASANDSDTLLTSIRSGLLKGSNNILALEYLQALIRLGSTITPLPVTRIGSAYHSVLSPAGDNPYPSAEAIRNSIHHASHPLEALLSLQDSMPEDCLPLFLDALTKKTADAGNRYDLLLHYSLQNAVRLHILDSFEDISGDLADRMCRLLPQYENASSFAELLKSRQYTRTHIDRALIHVVLDMKKQAYADPAYVRILGFRAAARPLLHKMQKTSSIPLITKPADARKYLSAEEMEAFSFDLHASGMYSTLLQPYTGAIDEYRHSPIIVQ